MQDFTIKLPKQGLFHTADELEKWGGLAIEARKELLNGNGKGKEFLGWLDLPTGTDKDMLSSLKSDAQRIASNSQLLVVVGIG